MNRHAVRGAMLDVSVSDGTNVSELVVACQVPFDIMLSEKIFAWRMVFLLIRGPRMSTLSPSIHKQQHQAHHAQADASPGEEATV
jgi:hypothetical protein